MSSYHQATSPQSSMIRPSYPNDEGITTTDNNTNNNNNNYKRPQHLQAQPQYQHTPHGAMTSILSAADYSPINYDNSSNSGRKNGSGSKEKGIKIIQTNNSHKKEDSNTKKALRMRASKYFHRSPTPPINNKSSNNKNMARQNNSPQSDATTALATTSTITTTTQQQVHISPTVTPDNNNTKQSIFSTNKNTNNNSMQRPPNENIPRPEPTQSQSIQIQAEAKLTSANIQQLQQQSITINSNFISCSNNYNSDINSDPSLELYPSASNSNANGYSNSNVNGYDSDIQSNATSGYNSGSDLENAARRIMRGKGKRKLPKVPVQLNIEGLNNEDGGKEGEGIIRDGNLSDIGNVSDVDIDSKQDSRKGKKKGLPTGWRERIQRKTGIELPTMNTTSPSRKRNTVASSARVEEENSAADYALSTILNQHHQQGGSYEEEGNDQIQPLPNYRNMSSTTIDYSDDYARGQSQYSQNQYTGGAVYQNDNEQFALMNDTHHQQHAHVPYGQYNHNQQYQHNVQFGQGQQQYRQHDQEYYIEDLVNNGAFPNYDYVGRGQPQSRQGYVQQQQPGSYGYPPPQGGYSYQHPHDQYQQQNSSELPLPTTYEYQNGNNVSYNYNRERGEDDQQQYYSNQDESWNPDNVIQKEQLSTIHDVSQENDDSGINTSMQAVNEADNSTDYSQSQKSQQQQQQQQQQQGFVPITINSLGFPPTPNEDTFDDPGFILPSAFNNDSPPLEKQTKYTEVKRVRFSSSVEGNDNEDDVPDDEKEEDISLLSSKSQPQQQQDASSAGWEEIPTSAWYDSNNNGNSTNYFATSDANENEVKNSTQDKSTAEFDIFAWNEEDDDYGGVSSMPQWKLRKMTAENKVSTRQSSPSRSNHQRSRDEDEATSLKLSPTKPVYVFDNERQRTPPSQQNRNIYPHSDGDISRYDTSDVEGGQNNTTPGRRRSKSSRRGGGLSFFKSRRKYASEGERSDSEWESSADEGYVHNSKPSFSMSPLRGRRKKKSSKGYGRSSMSPLGKKLFGHRQHHSLERIEVNEGKYTWDGGEQTLPPPRAHSTGRSSNVITTGHIIEAQRNVASPSTVMNSPIRTKTEHLNAVTYQQIEAEKSILNTSKDSSGNNNLNSSGNNLNISGVTQETERHSNMKPLNNKSHPWKKSDSSQKVEQHDSKIEQSVSKESILSGEQSVPTITTEPRENDEDTISTLGSLVTKGSKSKSKKITSSDMSTVTELSEIEKLRQENARLREELENASQISSNVVSMYARTLKNENHRLKEELEHTSVGTYSPKRNGMFKSTLETLLEEDNKKRIKKQNRRRRLKSMTAARQEVVTDFNLLPPAAHLINGVDFDDSITAYSQPERRGGGCETAVLLLKSSGSKLATTTRTVASQVKIVAQDMNNERKLNGIDGAACVDATSRPLDCFRTCHRNKDGRMDNTYRIARKKKKKPQVADGSSTTGSLTLDDSLTNGDSLIDSQKTKSPTRRRRQAKTAPI